MDQMAASDTFRSHWLAAPIAALFPGIDPTRGDLTIEIRCGEEPMTVRSQEGRVSVHPGRAAAPDLVLTGPPDALIALLSRRIKPAEAKVRGLAVTGDVRLLSRLR
jgi:hypothetical protein